MCAFIIFAYLCFQRLTPLKSWVVTHLFTHLTWLFSLHPIRSLHYYFFILFFVFQLTTSSSIALLYVLWIGLASSLSRPWAIFLFSPYWPCILTAWFSTLLRNPPRWNFPSFLGFYVSLLYPTTHPPSNIFPLASIPLSTLLLSLHQTLLPPSSHLRYLPPPPPYVPSSPPFTSIPSVSEERTEWDESERESDFTFFLVFSLFLFSPLSRFLLLPSSFFFFIFFLLPSGRLAGSPFPPKVKAVCKLNMLENGALRHFAPSRTPPSTAPHAISSFVYRRRVLTRARRLITFASVIKTNKTSQAIRDSVLRFRATTKKDNGKAR